MAEATKIVKGGFRATLALVISICALIVSVMTYAPSVKNEAVDEKIKSLQAAMEKMKAESGDQLDKLREETARTLDKMSQALKMNKTSGSNDKGTARE